MLLDAPAPPPCGNSASSVTATITPRTTAAPTPSPTANRALRLRAPRGPVKGPEMVLAAAWVMLRGREGRAAPCRPAAVRGWPGRSEEHTSELQSRGHLVCRLLLEKKNTRNERNTQED